MKKPGKMKPGHVTGERAQGKAKGSGVDKPMKKAAVPQKKPGVTYGRPGQKQGM